MRKEITPIEEVIPEENIVVFSPHYDDFLFMLGGYVTELKRKGRLNDKNFHIVLLFSRSNYLARTGWENFDNSLDRVKLATGKRLLEDLNCINELLGRYKYTYEVAGEDECFVRGKQFAASDMEFPHGMFEDFAAEDWDILERMKIRIRRFATHKNTALVFPLAFKEHIDHFITREAAIGVANENPGIMNAKFYFQEDKPYGGIATEEELQRAADFVRKYKLEEKTYVNDYERVTELAFRHYVSQVEEVYRTGIRERAEALKREMGSAHGCDRIYRM